jgi:ankyrin repeat protein
VDCVTINKYTPLHRCAFYNHKRLAGLFCMAGANQKAIDGDGKTAYEVAVEQGNTEVAQLLKPLLSSDGTDMTGVVYARNNPNHPEFRPQGREALFALAAINASMEG